MSGSRCRFAYGSDDATATHYLLLQCKSRLVLSFWCRIIRILLNRIQQGRKMVVCACVRECMHACVCVQFRNSPFLLCKTASLYCTLYWLDNASLPKIHNNIKSVTQSTLHAFTINSSTIMTERAISLDTVAKPSWHYGKMCTHI